ncbi:MAG: valine--tRNA ligase [Candidatus Aenigmarchaeota archaeon]|nr:valine--tRNA ligase [Candidatus Aenigmarchaeota archaeon]
MLPKSYDFKKSEKKWQKFWVKEKTFKFDPKSKKPIYSIDTPPPTVSGKMHLGHSFSYSQLDFVARFKRMRGFELFYPFGTDDNGLATIRMVEQEKGVKGTEMRRKEFIKLVLKTLKVVGPKYVKDWKKIGMSCDWSIYYTTINEHCRRISQKSFLDLYKAGKIYRKRTPFLWCPECQTSIAQVEMKDHERESKFVYMKFDTSVSKPITIATTRPELLPACVMIYVNPRDKRYKEFIGTKAKIPFSSREVDIKADESADPEFGSGAVYHCTFGDMDDVEWMEKYKIKPIEIMNKDGRLNEKAGKYKGMTAHRARNAIMEDLRKEGRIDKTEKITHVVNTHERCGTDIEILMTEQWFISYLDLKNKFLKAGKGMKWFPTYMRSRYDNWIKGLKWDWNISRQRHFGVPIPVWFCEKCGEILLPDEKDLPVDPTEDRPHKACKCGSRKFRGDPDVLDTWATSSLTPQIAAALFPKIYGRLYPMSMRPQAHDIITFWLFNTVVKSQMHSNLNPWNDIMISGWALDPKGKKMSKSKGNVIEPQEIIEKYGADPLRFWASGSKLGDDLPFQEKDLITGKKFSTKLWNASRFAMMHLKGYKPKRPRRFTEIDKWILSKLSNIIKVSTEFFDRYEYSKTKAETEKFFWHTFCDYYLEIVKDRLYNKGSYEKWEIDSVKYTLYYALLSILKLMSPITPHITEEVYQLYFRKSERDKSIHISKWPEFDNSLIDHKAEKVGDMAVDIIASVRKFKSENSISLAEPLRSVTIDSSQVKPVLREIQKTMKVENIKIGKAKGRETENFKIKLEIMK